MIEAITAYLLASLIGFGLALGVGLIIGFLITILKK